MNPEVVIQNMGVEHVADYSRMLVQMVVESPRNYSVTPEDAAKYSFDEQFHEKLTKAIEANSTGRFVAITDSGGVAGVVTTIPKEDSLRIGNMYVDPQFRCRGLGASLLQACETRAAEDGFHRTSLVVCSENEAATRLYVTHGYAKHPDEEPKMVDIHPNITSITLYKDLGELEQESPDANSTK